MELEKFDGWTIDRRLKQLRKIRETDDKILFVDFDDELGQMIFEKKILVDYYTNIKREDYKNDEDYNDDLDNTHDEIVAIDNLIGELEGKL